MVNNLTRKQQKTLDAIQRYIAKHGIPPTLGELQVLLEVTSNQSVLNHLHALEEKGYIRRRKTARGIRVIHRDHYQKPTDTQDINFMDLLRDMAQNREQRSRGLRPMKYFYPYSFEGQKGEILVGYYNNEQY